jgi:hypothetical protein
MSRLTSLKLDEFSDRELLALILDIRDPKGLVTSVQIASVLDPDHKHPVQCVGIRMGWMKRYGAVAKAPEGAEGWVLTETGERIARGELGPRQQAILETLRPEQGLDAALELGRLFRRIGFTEATLLRRGWQHASGRR